MKRIMATTTAALLLVAVGVAGALPTKAAGSGDFVEPATSPEVTGTAPGEVVVGRFDADADDDLVVVNEGSDSMSLLQGDGAGDFSGGAGVPVGGEPRGAAVGRFNADALDDVAVTSFDNDDVDIMLSTGTGSFTPVGTGEATETEPVAVAVGRFNADANDDLAVANGVGGVTILLGNGAGDFTEPATSPEDIGDEHSAVVVGRFNADANDDLAVTNDLADTVTILLGNGAGDFTEPAGSPVPAGAFPFRLDVGRFNADANDDLAVTNSGGVLTILLGDGAGGFAQPSTSPEGAGGTAASVVVGRLNGDANDDLAVPNPNSDEVTILFGDGTGNFTEASTSPETAGDEPARITVGRFNGDADDDLAVSNHASNDVTILLNTPVSTSGGGSGGGGAGGAGPAGPPGSFGRTSDSTPPDTSIVSDPITKTRDRTPTFVFISNEPEPTFECSMDGGSFVRCASPFTTPKLARGATHTFAVRARDQAGNVDPTPAGAEFKVKKKHQRR